MDQSGKTGGELLRSVIEKKNLSITEVAEWAGTTPKIIEKILFNQIAISTEIAYRLSMATGISMSVWTRTSS
jgi:plasmid maintenance system antidote protein VapI